MSKSFMTAFFTIIFFQNVWGASIEDYLDRNAQSGDLIFQSSKDAQSEALQEGSGSHITHVGILFREGHHWNVYEAVQPVKITSVRDFARRGKENRVIIKRVKKSFIDLSLSENQRLLKKSLKKFLGLNYDIYFEWSDDKIYCSEFVYKGFFRAFGKSPGQVQKMKDFNLDGSYVRDLIIDRYDKINKKFNINEQLVSPVSLYNDKALEFVVDSKYELENGEFSF